MITTVGFHSISAANLLQWKRNEITEEPDQLVESCCCCCLARSSATDLKYLSTYNEQFSSMNINDHDVAAAFKDNSQPLVYCEVM